MFDHVGLNVRDFEASRAFYEQALAPLGWRVVLEFAGPEVAGFGPDGRGRVSGSTQREPYDDAARTSRSRPTTVRRSTPSTPRRSPPAARTTAPPGLREHYHANYYGAFVLDPDGNNVEAVCHKPD